MKRGDGPLLFQGRGFPSFGVPEEERGEQEEKARQSEEEKQGDHQEGDEDLGNRHSAPDRGGLLGDLVSDGGDGVDVALGELGDAGQVAGLAARLPAVAGTVGVAVKRRVRHELWRSRAGGDHSAAFLDLEVVLEARRVRGRR